MMNSFYRLINTIFDMIPLGPHNRSIRHALRQWMLRVWRLFPSELSRVAHVCQLWNNRPSQHTLQPQSLQWWKGNTATQVSSDRGTTYMNSSGTNNNIVFFFNNRAALVTRIFVCFLYSSNDKGKLVNEFKSFIFLNLIIFLPSYCNFDMNS